MTADVLLQAHGLAAWYGAAQILFDVSLEVRRGEVVALMGRNGAGKSTTLKAVSGLLALEDGEMPDRPGGRMSGGEQQMLTVARTLMGNPHLVLLDEPSEGVAPKTHAA